MWREGLYNPHWAGVINVKEVNSMGKRKAISKKMRFEVFKRDKFTCQYCGRSVPDRNWTAFRDEVEWRFW